MKPQIKKSIIITGILIAAIGAGAFLKTPHKSENQDQKPKDLLQHISYACHTLYNIPKHDLNAISNTCINREMRHIAEESPEAMDAIFHIPQRNSKEYQNLNEEILNQSLEDAQKYCQDSFDKKTTQQKECLEATSIFTIKNWPHKTPPPKPSEQK